MTDIAIPDAAVEHAAKVIRAEVFDIPESDWDDPDMTDDTSRSYWRHRARTLLAAVAPVIVAQALDEVADDEARHGYDGSVYRLRLRANQLRGSGTWSA